MHGPSFRWICVPCRLVIARPSGWTRLDLLQDKCECALHLRVVLAAGLQERKGRHRRCWRRRCRSIPAALPAAPRTPRLRPDPTRRRRPAPTPAIGPLWRPQPIPAATPPQVSVRAWCAESAPRLPRPDHSHRHNNCQESHTLSFRFQSFFWTMPSRQWLSRGTTRRAGANSSRGVTR
jgi:hypothetical protein